MINLLPPDLKSEYRYARRNSALLNILGLIGFGVLGLALLAAAGVLYLQQSSKTYTAQAESIQQALVAQKQAETEKKVEEISSSLKLSVQVLSQEVLFSQLLKQLAVITPSNTRLSGISISQLQGAVDISASVTPL